MLLSVYYSGSMPDPKQQRGVICENILTEHMLNLGFYVLRPMAAHGPIDLCAYDDLGNYYFLDAKMDSRRRLPGRTKKNRIYRALTEAQKILGVRIAYVDIETRKVDIVPPLPEK